MTLRPRNVSKDHSIGGRENANRALRSTLQGGPKMAQFLYALTLPNINRFSTLGQFHCQNQENICNKDPTTPQLCCYTTLWNVKCLKRNRIENKTTSVTTQLKKLTTGNNVLIVSVIVLHQMFNVSALLLDDALNMCCCRSGLVFCCCFYDTWHFTR